MGRSRDAWRENRFDVTHCRVIRGLTMLNNKLLIFRAVNAGVRIRERVVSTRGNESGTSPFGVVSIS